MRERKHDQLRQLKLGGMADGEAFVRHWSEDDGRAPNCNRRTAPLTWATPNGLVFSSTAPQRRDLMEIVEDRYGNGATVVPSQLPVEAWHDIVGEPTFADAILDRLIHNAHRLTLDGPSMRKTRDATAAKIVDEKTDT